MHIRIDVYKHAGYFPPEEAEPLKERTAKEDIIVPPQVLKRWVEKYQKA